MDEVIKVLINSNNWLALWLAYMIWRDVSREARYDANVKMFIEVARNSTIAIAAFTEMMKTRKEIIWGEEFDKSLQDARHHAERRMGEDAL